MTTDRLIAVEEAFATEGWLREMRRCVADASDLDADTTRFFLSDHPHGSAVRARLLDVGEGRLAAMDACGIERAILSLMSPGVQMFDADRAVGLARDTNDELAEIVAAHPDRYAGFACIAPQDPASAAREIQRASEELGFVGVLVNSHTRGEYLDEPKFAPILEAAAATGMPLYIHPRNPPGDLRRYYVPEHGPRLTEVMWGFHAETGLHAAKLLVSDVFTRHPDLQVVLGHLGEGVPMLLWRMQWASALTYKLERTPWDVFRDNFHVTTSGLFRHPSAIKSLAFAIDLLGAERVQFAADYPFGPMDEPARALRGCGLDEATLAAVGRKNAEALYGPW